MLRDLEENPMGVALTIDAPNPPIPNNLFKIRRKMS